MRLSFETFRVWHGLLGVTFLFAGLSKMWHRRVFADQLSPVLSAFLPQGMVKGLSRGLATGLAVVEIAVGSGIALTESTIPLLLGLSIIGVGTAWYSLGMVLNDSNECGCFLVGSANGRGGLRILEGHAFLNPVFFAIRNSALSFLLLSLLGVSGVPVTVFLLASYVCVAGGVSAGVVRARSKLTGDSHELEPVVALRMESVIIVEWAQKECYPESTLRTQ